MGMPKTEAPKTEAPKQWSKRRNKKDVKALEYLEKHNILSMKQLTDKNIIDLYDILDGKEVEDAQRSE